MTIQIEFWQLLGGLFALFGVFFTFALAAAKLLLGQVSRQLDTRFAAIDIRFAAIEATDTNLQALEKSFLRFQADLPLHYVRREDYVRGQTVIEAKLDAINNQVTALLREGAFHDRLPAR